MPITMIKDFATETRELFLDAMGANKRAHGFRFGGGKGGADDIEIPDPIKPDNPFQAAMHSDVTKQRKGGSSGIQASQLTKFWNEPILGAPGLVGQEMTPLGVTDL